MFILILNSLIVYKLYERVIGRGRGMFVKAVSRGGLLAAALLATALSGCNGPAGAQNGAPPAPEVGIVEIAHQPFEQTVSLSGRVSAFEVSEVRPQIGGIVRSRRFTEGATVRAGQLLYEIDPGPTRADAAGAEAAAASARARYERLQGLVSAGAVSQQNVDDARAAAEQAQAAANSARINVNYTRVTAPISGVIGASSVTAGALATPGQAAPFAVIQQIDRVYIDMTMSSAELMSIRQQLTRRGGEGARVRLTLQDGTVYPLDGELQFSDVTVGASTGAVRLRALFRNPNHLLLPGMFVQAELSVGVDPQAILVPQRGVSRNARGEGVALLLNRQNVVEERIIETGATAGDQWVVVSGLNPGDRVIVEGAQRVRPGAEAQAAAPAQPATQDGALQLRDRQEG
jgi:membrane fusion protein, multidrug efflux system